jgi:hypothetical protein
MLDERLADAAAEVGQGCVAMAAGRIPIFLVPDRNLDLMDLSPDERVTIHWTNDAWYLDRLNGRRLFSFDPPVSLLERYARGGELTQSAALDLKAEHLNTFQIAIVVNNVPRLIRLRLDSGWLARARAAVAAQQTPPD